MEGGVKHAFFPIKPTHKKNISLDNITTGWDYKPSTTNTHPSTSRLLIYSSVVATNTRDLTHLKIVGKGDGGNHMGPMIFLYLHVHQKMFAIKTSKKYLDAPVSEYTLALNNTSSHQSTCTATHPYCLGYIWPIVVMTWIAMKSDLTHCDGWHRSLEFDLSSSGGGLCPSLCVSAAWRLQFLSPSTPAGRFQRQNDIVWPAYENSRTPQY